MKTYTSLFKNVYKLIYILIFSFQCQQVNAQSCAGNTFSGETTCPTPTTITDTSMAFTTQVGSVANVQGYIVEISDSNTFTGPEDGSHPSVIPSDYVYAGSGDQVIALAGVTRWFGGLGVVSNLSPATTYYFRVRAYFQCDYDINTGTWYYKFSTGDIQSFTTCGNAPNAATASDVATGATSLTLNSITAPVSNAGSGYVSIINTTNSFTVPSDGNTLPTANTTYAGSGEQVFYAGNSTTPNTTVTGLTADTTYYVKTYAYTLCAGGNYYFESTGVETMVKTCTGVAPVDGAITYLEGQHVTGTTINLLYFFDDTQADGIITYVNDADNFTAPTDMASLPTGDLSWNNNGQQVVGVGPISGAQFFMTNFEANTQYYTKTYAYTLCDGVYRFNPNAGNVNFTTCNYTDAFALSPVFGTITDTSMELNSFTAPVPVAPEGAPTGYIIKMNTTNSFTPLVARSALPTGNTVYSGSGEQVVYVGTGTTPNITITGLTANTEYFFTIYAYFDGCFWGGQQHIYQQTGYEFSKSNDVSLVAPTITFNNITTDYTENIISNISNSFSSNSAGAVTYQILSDTGGGASLQGQNLHVGNAGIITIEASQASNGGFTSAKQTMTVTVNKGTPTLVSKIIFYEVNGGTTTIDLDSNVGYIPGSTYSIVGADLGYTITGNLLNVNNVPGSIIVELNVPGTQNYNAATFYLPTLFRNPSNSPRIERAFLVSDFSLNPGEQTVIPEATEPSGDSTAVNFSIIDDGGTGSTFNNITNTFTAGSNAGYVTLRATYPQNGLYDASQKDVTITVNGDPQTITFGALADKTVGDADFALTATSDSGLPVTYTSSNTAVATISGNTVTIVGAGTTNITASAAGSPTYFPATDVVQSLTVNKADQTITFDALANVTYGAADFNLTGSSDSGLALTYTSSNTTVATISGNTVTIVGIGTTNITASQAGNTNYNAATDVVQSFTVDPITVTDQTASVSPTSGVFSVDATVSLANTQSGVKYYLRDDSNNALVSGPIEGTGSGASFTNEVLTATKTYNVVGLPNSEPYKSAQFDGADDFGSISNTINTSLNTNNITVETWAYIPTSDDTDTFSTLITQEFNSNGNLGFTISLNGGKLEAGFFRSWGWYRVQNIDYPKDQWVHIAATYDQANIKLYINGVEVGSTPETGALPIATTGLGWRLGRRWDSALSSEFLFGGALAETRIWNVARTSVEINANKDKTILSATGLVASYTYHENSGSTTVDRTGNGHDATLNNVAGDATTWVASNNAVEMSVTPTVTVEAIADQTVSASPTSGLLSVDATVSLAGSQNGVAYYLRDDADNSVVEAAVAGTGSGLSFNSEVLTTSKTYNVVGIPETQRLSNIQFDGADDFGSISNAINTDLNTNHITVETWAYIPSSDDTDTFSTLITQEYVGNNNLGFTFYLNAGKLTAGFLRNGAWLQILDVDYTKDQWMHIAFTYDQTNIKLYIDGVEVGSVAETGTLPIAAAGSAWRLGRRWDNTLVSDHLFGGALAETRIWNVARTSAEINANMNKSIFTGTGLVASYIYDASSGSTVTDKTGNGYDVTLSNVAGDATTWITNSNAVEMSSTPTVTVNDIADQTVTVSPTSGVCSADATVSLASSESGVKYYLQDNSNGTIVGKPKFGTGSGLSFDAETLDASKTYQVQGIPSAENIHILQFDGTGDYGTIPNTINADLNTNNITLETWAYIPASDDTDNRTMLVGQEYDYVSKLGFALFIQGGEIGAGFYNSGWTELPTKYTYTKDQWMHIAVTYDQANIKLYINGTEEASVAATAALPIANVGWRLGRRYDAGVSSQFLFGGKLAETRIWNVARTEAEIVANIEKSIISATGLVASFPYVEGTGTTANDFSGNGHHATLTSFAGDNTNWIQPSVSLTMTDKPTVTVNAIADQTVSLTQPTTQSATISVANTQVGVSYSLRDDSNNSVIETLAGTGSGISFATDVITVNKTYNVYAEVSACNLQLTNTPTATFAKFDQTITFNALADKTYGDADFNLTATASSGLDVAYSSSNTAVATVSGNTVTIVGAGSTNITASQSGNDNYNPASNEVQSLTVNHQTIGVNPIVFIQGPYNTNGNMFDNLRNSNYIPLSTPYTDGETTTQPVLDVTGNDAIVDWVWVEIRDKNDNTSVLASTSALLQRDGNIVDVDGVSPLIFTLNHDSYYIAIAHLNHLGIITANPMAIASNTTIDLSMDTSLINGGNNAVTNMMDGYYAMSAGDFDGNGQTQNTDVTGILPLLGTSTYSPADLDMNGQIQNTDINNILLPNIGKGEQGKSANSKHIIHVIAPRKSN